MDAQTIDSDTMGAMAVWAKDALNGSSIEEPILVLELLIVAEFHGCGR